MLKVTVTYPLTGSRTYSNLTQREVNDIVSHISRLNEVESVDVRIKVEEQ